MRLLTSPPKAVETMINVTFLAAYTIPTATWSNRSPARADASRSAREASIRSPPSRACWATVTGSLPAVISVNEKINEPRYPTFKGIMAAKKKPVQALALADLSVAADAVGLANAASWVDDFAARPPRQAGVVVKDEGDGGSKAAAFLAERKFI